MAESRFVYGGQAVIEGVMIRGRRYFSLAVRRPSGELHCAAEPLNQFFTGRWRRVPFVRGVVVLIETLVLGIKTLNRSANIAAGSEAGGKAHLIEKVPRSFDTDASQSGCEILELSVMFAALTLQPAVATPTATPT